MQDSAGEGGGSGFRGASRRRTRIPEGRGEESRGARGSLYSGTVGHLEWRSGAEAFFGEELWEDFLSKGENAKGERILGAHVRLRN